MMQNNKIVFICSFIYVIAIKTIFMQYVPIVMESKSVRLAPSPGQHSPGSSLSILPPQPAPMLNQQPSAAANPKQPSPSSPVVSSVQGLPTTNKQNPPAAISGQLPVSNSGQFKFAAAIAGYPQPLPPKPGKSQPLAQNAGQPQPPVIITGQTKLPSINSGLPQASISGQMQPQAVISSQKLSTPKPNLPHSVSKMLLHAQTSTPILKQPKPPRPGLPQSPNSILGKSPTTPFPQQSKSPNLILEQLTPKPGSSQLTNNNLGKPQQSKSPNLILEQLTPKPGSSQLTNNNLGKPQQSKSPNLILEQLTPKPGSSQLTNNNLGKQQQSKSPNLILEQLTPKPGSSQLTNNNKGKPQLPILGQSQSPLTPNSTPKPGTQSPVLLPGQTQPPVLSGQPQLVVLPSGQLAALFPGPPPQLLLVNGPKLSTPSPGLLPQPELGTQKLQLLGLGNMSNQTIPPKIAPVTAVPNTAAPVLMKPQLVAPSQDTSAVQAAIKPSPAMVTIPPAQAIVNQPQMLASSSNATVLSPTLISAPPPPLTTLQQTPPPLQISPELIQMYLMKLAELQASKEKNQQNSTLNKTADHFPKLTQNAPTMNEASRPDINQNNKLLIDQANAPPLNQQNILTVNHANAPVINQGNSLTIGQPNAPHNPLSSSNDLKSVQDKLPSARGTNLLKSNQLGSSPPAIRQQNALFINGANVSDNQPKPTKNQLLIPNNAKPIQNKFSSGNELNLSTSPAINLPKKIQNQPSLIQSTLKNIPLALSQQIAPKPLTPQVINLASLPQQAQIHPNKLNDQLSPNLLAAIQKPAVFPPLVMTTSKPNLRPVGQSIIQVLPSKLAQLDKFCGVPSTSAFQTRIVGGTEAKLKSWPWMAAIFLNGRFDYVACAGALITNQFILTASHCIIDHETKKMRNISEYTIRLGEHDFSRADDGASPVDLKVLRLISYPEYDPIHKQGDIGLIQLSTVVTFTDSIIPVCLPTTPEVTNTTFYKQRPDISGWGFTSYGTYSNHILRNATVRVTQLWKCKAIYLQFNYTIDDTQICAGNNKIPVDVCQGDSGGPMVLKDAKNRMNIIGVISYGVRCAQEGFPGVYTKVSHFLPWIKQNANIS